jgi:hypothetical protein
VQKADAIEAIALFVVIIVIGLLIRLGAGSQDNARISHYIEERGGRVLDIKWKPFGPGWFMTKDGRIYEVRYSDKAGNMRLAHCKTSGWTGVYFTDDQVMTRRSSEAEEIAAENQRFRAEVERLRQIK